MQRACPERAWGKSTECHEFQDFSGCFQGVFRVFSGCFRGVFGVFSVFSGVFGCFRGVSRVFLGVFGVFSGSATCVFRVFSGCFSLCPFRTCPLDPFRRVREGWRVRVSLFPYYITGT